MAVHLIDQHYTAQDGLTQEIWYADTVEELSTAEGPDEAPLSSIGVYPVEDGIKVIMKTSTGWGVQ